MTSCRTRTTGIHRRADLRWRPLVPPTRPLPYRWRRCTTRKNSLRDGKTAGEHPEVLLNGGDMIAHHDHNQLCVMLTELSGTEQRHNISDLPPGRRAPVFPRLSRRVRRRLHPNEKLLNGGASTAGSRERIAKITPPTNSHGHTPGGSASVSNTDCSGAA
jgi:hypothetical protein